MKRTVGEKLFNIRNSILWKSEFDVISENKAVMRLVGKFVPIDFRDLGLEILDKHDVPKPTFLDNQLGNYIYSTIYNYAGFSFLKSKDSAIYPNVTSGSFDELGYERFTINDIKVPQERVIESTGLNLAAEKLLSSKDEWYKTILGSGFTFKYALNTNLFFGVDVFDEYVFGTGTDGNDGKWLYDNINKVLEDITENGKSSEYYNEYKVYEPNEKYEVVFETDVDICDEDRTYAICYVSPYFNIPMADVYTTNKSTKKTVRYRYEIVKDTLQYTDSNARLSFSEYTDNLLQVAKKTNAYKRSQTWVNFKIRRITEYVED